MEDVFTETVMILLDEGYIEGDDYFVDGTKVKADANKHKVIWKKNSRRFKEMTRQRAAEIIKEASLLNNAEIPQDTDPDSLSAAADKAEESINEDADSRSIQREMKSLPKKLKNNRLKLQNTKARKKHWESAARTVKQSRMRLL